MRIAVSNISGAFIIFLQLLYSIFMGVEMTEISSIIFVIVNLVHMLLTTTPPHA